MQEATSILIVDDAEIDRRRVGRLLEQWIALDVRFAADGREALAMMRAQPPALVLTDLQMPRVDGLELVATARQRHPGIPVILMTAHGSEEVAANALRCGAVSYVPKKHLARDLITTVRRVLRLVRPQRKYEKVLEILRATEYRFELDNDLALVHPLLHYLGEDLTRMDLFDDTVMMRVGVALDEAIRNAILHGNLDLGPRQPGMEQPDYEALIEQRRRNEPYAQRKVHMQVRFTPERATFVVEDEGAGYDRMAMPDPHDPNNLERTEGRGLRLIHSFMDAVHFNESGSQITMIRYRDDTPPAPTSATAAPTSAPAA